MPIPDNIFQIQDAAMETLSISRSFIASSGAIVDFSGATVSGIQTSSFAISASYWNSSSVAGRIDTLFSTKQNNIATGSILPITSSWSENVINIPFQSGTMGTGSTYPITSSWSTNSISSSYWNSSSVASRIDTLYTNKQNNLATGSSLLVTSSWSTNVVNAPFQAGTMGTGSTYPITASHSITASYWDSGSIATRIDTLFSNKQNNLATGSTLPITSSWAINVVNSSNQPGTMDTGSTYPITASWATNAISSSYWNSSSVATRIDTLFSNKQNNISTGSTLPITTSWSTNVVNAPFQAGTMGTGSTYPITSSWSTNSISSSYWNSSSVASRIDTLYTNKQNNISTGSTIPATSSWAINVVNSSNQPGTMGTGSTYPITSSWSTNSISASYWNSSSIATRIDTLYTNKQNNLATGSSLPITASWALTSSIMSGSVIHLVSGSSISINDLNGTDLTYAVAVGLSRPLRWGLFAGTSTSPVRIIQPLVKICRTDEIPSGSMVNGATNEQNTCLNLMATNTEASQVQVNTLYVVAQTQATSSVVNGINTDAMGIGSTGRVIGSGTGIGIGGYFSGRRDTTTGRANGLEVRCWNQTAQDGVFNNNGFSDTTGIWLTAGGTAKCAVAISLGFVNGNQWDVGLAAIKLSGGSSIKSMFIKDNSNATCSIFITGSHQVGIDLSSGSFSGNAIQLHPSQILFGTSSWSNNSISASWAPVGVGGLETGSTYPFTSSWSNNSISASWAPISGLETGSTYPITSSWSLNSISASWAPVGEGNGGLETGSTYPFTSSHAVTSSYTFTTPNWGVSVLSESCMAYYPCKEGFGNVLYDKSGFGRDLTISGSTLTWGVDNTGIGINALFLSCSTQTPTFSEGSSWTYEMFIKPADVVSFRIWFSTAITARPYLGIAGNVVRAVFRTAGGNDTTLTSSILVLPNQWYHIAFSHDSVNSASFLYVNGNNVGSYFGSGSGPVTNGHILGKHTSDAFNYTGSIGEVRIYSRSLSEKEIALHSKQIFQLAAQSSSYALSASWAPGSSPTGLETGSTYPITSSWALNAVSASWAPGGPGGGLETGSTYPITSSQSITSSYVQFSRPRMASFTLTDAAILQTDGNIADHFRVTLEGNRTLAKATASFDAQRLSWEFIQDGVGTRTITLHSDYITGSDFSVNLNQTASRRDFMTAIYNSGMDRWYVIGFVRGF